MQFASINVTQAAPRMWLRKSRWDRQLQPRAKAAIACSRWRSALKLSTDRCQQRSRMKKHTTWSDTLANTKAFTLHCFTQSVLQKKCIADSTSHKVPNTTKIRLYVILRKMCWKRICTECYFFAGWLSRRSCQTTLISTIKMRLVN